MMGRNIQMLMFCTLLFMAALVVADVTSVKLFSVQIAGYSLLVPVGTAAFAITFLATDVIAELFDRRHAVFTVWAGVVIRVGIMLYFIAAIGDTSGDFWFFESPDFWSSGNQEAYRFVFSGTFWIYIGGFAAIIVSSLNDVYVFHHLKKRHANRNLFWFRNNVSTSLSQIINSTVFISLAFATVLSIQEILAAIAGQVILKIGLAFLDTPFAYLMRNYGSDRAGWYKVWTADFWKG